MKSDKRRTSVTMADVAERAGVSRALVSIVFRGVPGASPQTRERVMLAAEELSYRPDQRARLLGSNRSRTVGVTFGLHHEFHAEVVEQLYVAAAGSGYELALGAVAPTRGENHAVQSLLDYRCEALVLVGTSLPRASLEALAERVPVVTVARAVRSRVVDVARSDDAGGVRLAVEHLVALGHRRIAHVHGSRAPGAAERRRGYTSAMRSAGLEHEVDLVPGGLAEEDGEAAARDVLQGRSRPSAVVAFNDHCAAGLMTAVRARGLDVPDDLAVTGFDDSRVAGLSGVALTTVAQDAPALAHSALELALARLEAPARDQPRTEVVVPPRLVLRRTTAPPRPSPA